MEEWDLMLPLIKIHSAGGHNRGSVATHDRQGDTLQEPPGFALVPGLGGDALSHPPEECECG